jgi:predicted RNA-binding Zn-ribbon protein involved in translation (DUF1610 family)
MSKQIKEKKCEHNWMYTQINVAPEAKYAQRSCPKCGQYQIAKIRWYVKCEGYK